MNQRPPLFGLLFVSMFGFIGITVLVFLWTAKGFGAPPLFFKVVGSFVAIMFILIGFGTPLSLLKKGQSGLQQNSLPRKELETSVRQGSDSTYRCPGCGAGIANQEVSPSGDVKCQFCKKWWNIHKST